MGRDEPINSFSIAGFNTFLNSIINKRLYVEILDLCPSVPVDLLKSLMCVGSRSSYRDILHYVKEPVDVGVRIVKMGRHPGPTNAAIGSEY